MNMHLFAALRADAVRILYVQGSLITVGSTAGPGSLNRRFGVVEAGHGGRNHEETSGKAEKDSCPFASVRVQFMQRISLLFGLLHPPRCNSNSIGRSFLCDSFMVQCGIPPVPGAELEA